ncbi:MAG TPA: acyl-CoA dehydrogenase family protein [Acidimicrobiales bacterium]|nr:acyl-CoA dehydrogenase family protein [Acidimicrobiales bacterium]
MAGTADRFDPTDLVALGIGLDAIELEMQQRARDFVEAHVLGEVAAWYADEMLPRELARALGAAGLLGLDVPGCGPEVGPVAVGLVMLELEAADSGVRSLASVHSSLAMHAISRFASEEEQARWLPGMSSGDVLGCFALTEPDAGSDPRSMRTRARRSGSDWVLDGEKRWVTNGGIADVAVVWAVADEQIRGFLVPLGTLGADVRPINGRLSLRASVSSELALDGCRIPAGHALPGAVGLRAALACLDEARYGIAWGAMGAARTCFVAALDHSLARRQFGKQLAAFQLTQAKLATMAVELEKGLLLAHHLGLTKRAGRLRPEQVSVGKVGNVRAALEIARIARTVLGAEGITLGRAVMRHMTNLEAVLTYEGTEEVHLLAIGRALTGLDAFA